MFVWYWNLDGHCRFFDFDVTEFLTDLHTMTSYMMVPPVGWDCE